MSGGIPLDQLKVGTVYRVDLEDCCIEGWFTARLTEIVRDDDGHLDVLRFDGAEIGPSWGSWTVSEVTS